MKNLLLSLLLLLAFTTEALADRGRLNRFGTLTVSNVNVSGGGTLDFVGGDISAAASDLILSGDDDIIFKAAGTNRWAINDSGVFDALTANARIDGNTTLPISIGDTTVATFSSAGLLIGLDGTVSAPTITLNDADTGFYRPNTNTIGYVTGGTRRAFVNTTGWTFEVPLFLGTATGATGTDTVLCRLSTGQIGECSSAVGAGGTCTCA